MNCELDFLRVILPMVDAGRVHCIPMQLHLKRSLACLFVKWIAKLRCIFLSWTHASYELCYDSIALFSPLNRTNLVVRGVNFWTGKACWTFNQPRLWSCQPPELVKLTHSALQSSWVRPSPSSQTDVLTCQFCKGSESVSQYCWIHRSLLSTEVTSKSFVTISTSSSTHSSVSFPHLSPSQASTAL